VSRSFLAVVIAGAVLIACGIKGPPRAPANQPPPVQSQPQTPMTQTPDAGCAACTEHKQ
jgi:predicted small lipoprotein YifL